MGRASPLVFLLLAGVLLDAAHGARTHVYMDGLVVDRLQEDSGPEELPPRSGPASFELRDTPRTEEPVTTSDHEWQRRSEAAAGYFNESRWEAALREYRALIRLRPDHLPSIERAAVAASLARRYGVADGYFAQVAEARPDDVSFLVGWGGVLVRLRRFEEASQRLQSAAARAPDHMGLRYNQLILQVALGREGDDKAYWAGLPASSIATVANWLAVDRVELPEWLGADGFDRLTQVMLGLESAERVMEVAEALRAGPRAIQARDWAAAIESFKAARALGVMRYHVDMELAHCLAEDGQVDAALDLLQNIHDAHPDRAEAAYNLGFAHIRAGHYETALALLDEILQQQPDHPEVRFARVCALAGAGRMDEAWPEFRALADAYPDRIADWMEGDQPYLRNLRADSRYPGHL